MSPPKPPGFAANPANRKLPLNQNFARSVEVNWSNPGHVLTAVKQFPSSQNIVLTVEKT